VWSGEQRVNTRASKHNSVDSLLPALLRGCRSIMYHMSCALDACIRANEWEVLHILNGKYCTSSWGCDGGLHVAAMTRAASVCS
jgi:hypothetical protein